MNPSEIGSANVVVIGGGIVGCSIAYHLTQLGISDVVLLERKKTDQRHDLACGGLSGSAAGVTEYDLPIELFDGAFRRAGSTNGT